MHYSFRTMSCEWLIVKLEDCWQLRCIDGGVMKIFAGYNTPELAAQEIFYQHTSFPGWDILPKVAMESRLLDIGNWQKHR